MTENETSILLVDDRPGNLKVLLDLLKEQHFHVYIADSGERAVSTLENIEPDLILLDVMMPGMNGFETCRRIKSDERWAAIPVIFMTALDDVEDKLAGFDVGGVDYITKPFQRVEVLARINTHVALRKKDRERERLIAELKDALAEVKTLSGLLPVCAGCKKVRDDKGYWNQLETYLQNHTDANVSHGLCPDCMDKMYGGQQWYERGKKKGKF
jgi:CheY-like chemotaxis protein